MTLMKILANIRILIFRETSTTLLPPPRQWSQSLPSSTTPAFFSAGLATYHLGGTSSMEPYVTTTRASDRYTWQGHMDQYMIATKPRPLMVRSPHILPGTPMGFASGLNQFEQNRIRDLTKATNTARHRLDLQADTMNGMMGTIHMMDTQMTWMPRDYRESRAESQNAWCFLSSLLILFLVWLLLSALLRVY
ncbi:hypothetical protein Tco_1036951 [Tanacetum coccineum]